jgi:hypothetical protein
MTITSGLVDVSKASINKQVYKASRYVTDNRMKAVFNLVVHVGDANREHGTLAELISSHIHKIRGTA